MAGVQQETLGVIDEARKTKETAARLANGEYPDDADHIRVLAGMVQQVAEQVERLAEATVGGASQPEGAAEPNRSGKSPEAMEAERVAEEDQSPERSPADPINDRT